MSAEECDPAALRSAFADRLVALAPHLVGDIDPIPDHPSSADIVALLDEMVAAASDGSDPSKLWALVAASCAIYPTREDLDHIRRRLGLSEPMMRTVAFLDATRHLVSSGHQLARLDILRGVVLVDVDFSAKNELHTGIQNVVRSLLPVWDDDFAVVPVAWDDRLTVLRGLTSAERDRAVRWHVRRPDQSGSPPPAAVEKFVIPLQSVVVLVEARGDAIADRLAALGDRSSNAVVAVVYDMIPTASADLVLPYVASDFVRYLTAIKFTRRIAGISASAAEEFGGFVDALPTQGLRGPEVFAVPLPSPPSGSIPDRRARSSAPLRVLAVGSHEPRKNHLAVLHAAETLWREGVDFSLLFIGGGGWGDAFPQRVRELQGIGRAVDVRQAVSDAELRFSYREADLTIFPSLHEGFGLPIVESLSHGTPVIASDFGPMAEIAAFGGVLLVDPRDDEALTAALRSLLTDRARLAGLRDEIRSRPGRDWDTYAHELWGTLVAPEMAAQGISSP